MANRTSQEDLQILGSGSPDVRVSQNDVQVLGSGSPDTRVSQNDIQVLGLGSPKVRVSQNSLSILWYPTYDLLTTAPRKAAWQCLALNADGEFTFMDISADLQRWQTVHSDQLESHKCTLTFQNTNGKYDIYNLSAYASVLQVDRIISLKIGYTDDSGQTTLYPAFYGRIASVDWDYLRSNGSVIQVTVLDLMYPLLTETVTTNPFYNQSANLIAQDLLKQYAQRNQTNLAPLEYVVPFAQFPSFTVADAFKDLFDLVLYFVWFDYSGNLATSPRVGSAASGSPNLVGYPDAASPPSDSLVSFTFPDANLIEEIRPSQRIFTFSNQVRVLGQSLNETITYGPVQLLATYGDANNQHAIAKKAGLATSISLTQQTGNQNLLTATGVYVEVYCNNFHNYSGTQNIPYPPGLGNPIIGPSDNIKRMCSDPTATQPNGDAVPLGPFESNGHNNNRGGPSGGGNGPGYPPSIIATDNNGNDMGMLFLPVDVVPGITMWTSVPISGYANSDNNGFSYYINVYGKPTVSTDAILTKIIDYDITLLDRASAVDIFGDHRTYQVLDPANGNSVQPLAMGTPVEVYVNPSTLPTNTLAADAATTDNTITLTNATGFITPGSPPSIKSMNSLVIGTGSTREYAVVKSVSGDVLTLENTLEFDHAAGEEVAGMTLVISADGVNISQLAQIAFEQGQIVFLDMTYKDYAEDDSIHPYSTGGEVQTTSATFDRTFLQTPAPCEVYSSFRQCTNGANGTSFFYTFPGLEVGRGYTVILSYADPQSTLNNSDENQNFQAGQRVFDISFNDVPTDLGFDTFVSANGLLIASIKQYEGVIAEPDGLGDGTGTLTITFTNNNPNTSKHDWPIYPAMVSAIEVYDPQGIQGDYPVVNCGGPAITPTPPTLEVTAAYSANQRIYGIKNEEINNPLLGTIDACTDIGQWYTNQQAWERNPMYLKTASIPTIQPAQIVKFFNPMVNTATGTNQYLYVQQITRTGDRSDPQKPVMYDEYNGFLVYSEVLGGFTIQQLNSNPVALYPLNDSTGATAQNVAPGSAYGVGTYSGTPSLCTALCADQTHGMQTGFDIDPGVIVPIQPESLGQFSIEFLMKLPPDPGGYGFYGGTVSGNYGDAPGIQFTCTDNGQPFGTPGYFAVGVNFTGGYQSLQTATLPWNTLCHVVLTWDGNTLTLYLNDAVVEASIPSGTLVPGASHLTLGYSLYNFGGYPSALGIVGAQYNNLAVYSYALSPDQVTTHYDAITNAA